MSDTALCKLRTSVSVMIRLFKSSELQLRVRVERTLKSSTTF